MDPISFTASLLTLITVAGQSCKVISEFVLDIHDAPKDIYAQSIKLQSLQQSFDYLLSVFSALPPDLQLDTVFQQNLVSFTQEIDGFTAKVKEMGIRMGQGRVQHAWERVKWLASDRDLKRFNQSLDHWDRVFAAAAAAAQLSMSIRILEHTTKLTERHTIASGDAAPAGQALVRPTQDPSSVTGTLQAPSSLMPGRSSMFLSTLRDPVDLRIQERFEYLGDTMTAIVQGGPVMVRSWSNTGQDTYSLMPAAEAYGLAFAFQITRLLPGRLSLKILAMYSTSSMFSIDVKWRLNFVGLLRFNSSAYHAAATGNWLFLRDLLVNKEIRITHRTIYGDTLLHIGTKYGHIEIVRELLLAGADVNATNDEGDTPLHTAVKTTCNYEIIRLLLKHGSNLHHQNRQGRTPLHCYYNTTLQETIRYCRDDIDNTTQDYLGMTVAHYAAYSKSSTAEDIAICLKDISNPFAARDSDGRTVLHLALQRGNIALIEYILGSPHAKDALLSCDWYGRTPLHFATTSPRTQAIDLVLDSGFDIHATDLYGHTAMHHAASMGNLGAVEKLLERGAMQDLKRRDREGRTPLMAARWRGRREVEEYLRPLCADEDGNEVEEALGEKKEIYGGTNGWRALRNLASLQMPFVLLLAVLVVLLVCVVLYVSGHEECHIVDV
ncbi:hypothetical protein AA0114_g6842 [Alternaria tenuissima]|uniref:Azaphilone pigments biosynthesis cluster protein L N-terminal domain-containing protein n=1 Tax=Alternaria tenuissima TaxID=119927 RepID=A0A4V1WMP2_9PLEO|nr:hypothetical protein AA0114_g6842 [Alternaria tenuissima]